MRNRFDSQLELLYKELIEMGAVCEEMITLSQKSLKSTKIYLEEAKARELEVNRLERDIENLCMKLLLEQQPVAGDLRLVSSALRMISDMERIGDQSLDIIEILSYVKNCDLENKQYIEEMANVAGRMVSESVDSFVRKDSELAKSVILSDDIVDDMFVEMKKRVVQIITKEVHDGEKYIDLIMVAKYYERIADHATNIAEWVVYALSGTKVMPN